MERSKDSEYFRDVLEKALLARATEIHLDWWILVQDNASVDASEYTDHDLMQRMFTFSHSQPGPQSVIIENARGITARHVYAHGRQFADNDGLTDGMQSA